MRFRREWLAKGFRNTTVGRAHQIIILLTLLPLIVNALTVLPIHEGLEADVQRPISSPRRSSRCCYSRPAATPTPGRIDTLSTLELVPPKDAVALPDDPVQFFSLDGVDRLTRLEHPSQPRQDGSVGALLDAQGAGKRRCGQPTSEIHKSV